MITKNQKPRITVRESEIISDCKSDINRARRGRPSVPAALMLAAVDEVFSAADAPRTVTMDAIAAAAGVGKGTLFRAFGNRDNLLEALWGAKLAVLRDAVEEGPPPLGPKGAPRERAVAFLDALVMFKLENRHLIRARESASAGLRQSEHYRWMHGLLLTLIRQAGRRPPMGQAEYSAHVLLGALHIDLIEDLLATGRSIAEIRSAQAVLARAVIDHG